MAFTAISFISFSVILTFFSSSVLVNLVKARTTSTGIHSQDPLGDGVLSQTHFADFIRALYAPQMTKERVLESDLHNELFPIMEEHHDEEHDNQENEGIYEALKEFPSTGVIIPVLQKRNARYCGSFLADALQMACSKSSYQTLFGKRSSPGNQVLQSISWPFVDVNKAHQMFSNQLFHRNTRGVHDECCLKGCSFKELTSYCTRPSI